MFTNLQIEKVLSVITPDATWRGELENTGLSVDAAVSDGVLEVSLVNVGSKDIHINEVHIDLSADDMNFRHDAKDCRHYIHWDDFRNRDGVKPMHMPAEWTDEVAQPSNMLTVMSSDLTGQAVLLGALPPYSSGFTWFDVMHHDKRKAGKFGLRIRMDFRQKLLPGAKLLLPPLLCLQGDSGEKLLDDYAKLTAQRAADKKRKANITGWSSWDYYAGGVTRENMDENRESCDDVFGDGVEYIIIDDGYQNIWGHWDANWKFPGGLEAYCSACVDGGKKPGIWTAPLMVSINTPLFCENPEWFISGVDGNVYQYPCGSWGTMGQLDPTIPEVQQHLKKVFSKLREAGFEYYKIDFTQILLEAGDFFDQTIGKAEAYKILFSLIREAIGEDAYLMGCGAPYEAVAGIVDAVRTGSDIHNFGTMAGQCARSLFGRLWMQTGICNIDPDFLIVRGPQTSDDKYRNRRTSVKPLGKWPHWHDGPEFDVENAKFWALAVYLAGGDMVLGDRIASLRDNGLEILKRVLKKGRQPAKWINQFDPRGQDVPVLLTEYSDRYELGVFNISTSVYMGEIPARLPFATVNARDFWTNEKCETERIVLKPNESRSFIFSK